MGSPADRLVAAQQALAGTPVGAVLDGFVDALEHVPGHGEWAVVEPRAARTLLAGLYAAEQRLRGLVDAGIAAAETEGWIDEVGLGAPSWLHQFNAENRLACVRRVARARRVSEQPRLAEAVASGEIAPDQAAQVARVLTDLPQSVGAVESAAAAETMVQLSAEHDPRGLSGLAGYLLEVVVPERSEQLEAERLAAQEARASRERELYFSDDGHGAVRIRGKLPVVEAAQLRSAVDALAYRRRRALVEGADSMLPGVVDDAVQSWLDASGASDAGAMPMTSLARCRADALVELAHMAAAGGDLPAHGGDRPRLAVTVDQDTLRRDSGLAALADGTPVSWARARQIACDAAALPIVLDGAGVPLAWAVNSGSSPVRCVWRCCSATAGACSPDVIGCRPAAMCTTSSHGGTAVRRTSTTASRSAPTTTGWSNPGRVLTSGTCSGPVIGCPNSSHRRPWTRRGDRASTPGSGSAGCGRGMIPMTASPSEPGADVLPGHDDHGRTRP